MRKFLIINNYQHYEVNNNEYIPTSVWVTDFEWYNTVDTEITEWLLKNGCIMPGLVIKFPSEEVLTLFLLRWQ